MIRIVLLITGCILLIFQQYLVSINTSSQFIIFLIGILLLGVPHGAADLLVANRNADAGKKVFFYTGNIIVENGTEIFVEALVKHSNENECIVITSMYQPSLKEKYGKEAKRAIISAKVIE